jgi:hypothetical protein
MRGAGIGALTLVPVIGVSALAAAHDIFLGPGDTAKGTFHHLGFLARIRADPARLAQRTADFVG